MAEKIYKGNFTTPTQLVKSQYWGKKGMTTTYDNAVLFSTDVFGGSLRGSYINLNGRYPSKINARDLYGYDIYTLTEGLGVPQNIANNFGSPLINLMESSSEYLPLYSNSYETDSYYNGEPVIVIGGNPIIEDGIISQNYNAGIKGMWEHICLYTGSGSFDTVELTNGSYTDYTNYKGYLLCAKRKLDDNSIIQKFFWVKCDEDNVVISAVVISGNVTITTTDEDEDEEEDDQPVSDEVIFPDAPSIDLLDSGMIKAYKPNLAQLRAVESALNSSSFVEAVEQSFKNPLDTIICLNLVPCIGDVETSGSDDIVLGSYTVPSTGGTPVVSSQWVTRNMGSVLIETYHNNALDYEPYTTVQLFIPYIGFVDLNTNEVMGKTVTVKIRFDIITGNLIAYVLVNGSTYQTFQGNCSMTVPVTGSNYGNMYKSMIQTGVGVAGNLLSGNIGGAIQSATSVLGTSISHQRGGSLGMSAGYMGVKYCFVIISRPKQSIANNMNKYIGKPCNQTYTLSSLSGFTVFRNVNLDNVPATKEELQEIEALMKEGVIL